jgi:microcystin-dependent protein
MTTPYVGEIRLFAGNFAPANWYFCNGQLLPIAEFDVLFNLIGTTYGGDGQSTFALPDMRGRIPVHASGTGPYLLGESGGVENVTLQVPQLPAHQHAFVSTQAAINDSPAGSVLAATPTASPIYSTGAPGNGNTLSPSSNVTVGGGQPHSNLMPYQCVSFIISAFGIFPSS